MTLVYPQNVTLYQVGDITGLASFSNLLDAFDGSFCANDNPDFDATYPDPLPGGYQGPEQCGGIATTKVISTRYVSSRASTSVLTPIIATDTTRLT